MTNYFSVFCLYAHCAGNSQDIHVKSEQEQQKEESEKEQVNEERKRKSDSVISENNDTMKQIPEKINGENTDVNGNEGPEAKKRKVVYLDNGNTNGTKPDTLSVSCHNVHFIKLKSLYTRRNSCKQGRIQNFAKGCPK